eukprot:scaffold1168_cov167-Amphora_coffeaeformis.AAC.35
MSVDPFDVFGGDGDDSDGDEIIDTNETNEEKNAEKARELLAQANRPHTNNASAVTSSSTGASSVSTSVDNPMIHDVSSIPPMKLPWKDPLYTNENIRLVSTLPVGGGRGYIAVQDLPPGTLVMLEDPILAWPEGETSSIDLERVQVILMNNKANEVVSTMESFHPTRVLVNETVGRGVTSSNPSQIEDMIQHYREAIQEGDLRLDTILELAAAKEVTNSDGSPTTKLDVLRMLVALRYNSLETGIYPHVAMLNHDDFPNCVKFRPTERRSYSEVRTVRRVLSGESLTISYLVRYKCHASRRQHLWKQHCFDIGELKTDSPRVALEMIHEKLPSTANVELMRNIETATAELEDQCRELDEAAVMNKRLTGDESETAKALEMASEELCTSTCEHLGNDAHVLLLPCLALHLDACDLVQRHAQLPKRQRALLLARLITTGRKLAELQTHILGPDHFDTAKTYLDVAQGIQELLSESPKELFASDKSIPSTVHGWSLVESTARREHERIKKLYPHDADKYLP